MPRKATTESSETRRATPDVEPPGLTTGPGAAGAAWPRPSWAALLTLGLLTRVAVVVWGVQCCAHLGPPPKLLQDESLVAGKNVGYNSRHLAALADPARKRVEPWYRWDALWYAEISAFGYAFDPRAQSSTAFLPLLPMVMAAAARLGLDRYWAGLIVPNLAFAVGLAAFGQAALRVTGDRGTAWRACLLTAASPYSLFFSAPYQESLGFALMACAILAWLARRPLAAAVCLAWATLARLAALSLAVALIAEWFYDVWRRRPARHWAWLVALSSGLGFGMFCVYLGLHLGQPFAHLHAHSAWGRQAASVRTIFDTLGAMITQAVQMPVFAAVALAILIWTCLRPLRAGFVRLRAWVLVEGHEPRPAAQRTRKRSRARGRRCDQGGTTSQEAGSMGPSPADPDTPGGSARWTDRAANTVSLALALVLLGLALPESRLRSSLSTLPFVTNQLSICLFLGLGVHAFWRRGPFWGCLVVVPILQGLATGTFMSMTRIVLAAFPAFIDLAELLRPRWLFAIWLVAFVFAQVRLIDLFVNWGFVG